MNILFLHNAFPGQYRHIVPYVQEKDGVRVMVATLASNSRADGLDPVKYSPHRDITPNLHAMLPTTERAVINAQAAYEALWSVRAQGYQPDLICAHGGSGPAHFMKDLWPNAKLLVLHEWYHQPRGSNVDFLGPVAEDFVARTRMRNIPTLIDLAAQDWGVVPTCWQLRQFPEHLRGSLSVMHEGIDTQFFCPGDQVVQVDERRFTSADEVVTYTTRGMEPYRGFPQFMEAVARLQKRRPNMQVIIAGNDLVAYGTPRDDGLTYREHAFETLDLDRERIHFTGLIPLESLRSLFRISSAHVYLTVPFVLSWSMMEAMATGAPIAASRTEPVEEMITHEREGLLFDFFDVEAQAEAIERLLDDAALRQRLGQAARRRMVSEYDVALILPRQWELMQSVGRGELGAQSEVLTLSVLSHD